MKALWLREVRAILEREDFLEWWRALVELGRERSQLDERHEELLAQANLTDFRAELTQKHAIDTLYQAGELEDAAALLLAESAEIENKAYEAVANFEAQRIAVSDLYSQMGAVEHNFLSVQAEVEQLKADLEKAGEADRRKDISRQLRRKQESLSDWDRRLREASGTYERGHSRKMRLWEEVEQMWARSMDINLSVSEKRARSRRARKAAERLFKEAEGHKKSAEALSQQAEQAGERVGELEQAIEQQRAEARRLFGCIVGEEFLYWPRRESNKEVYCMPIEDHPTGFNIELEARNLYLVGRQRGVEFIEPLPHGDAIAEDQDRRIDDFFGGPAPEGAGGES
jgi:chromosome segregation ATPase